MSTQNADGTTQMAYNLAREMTALTDPDSNQTVWTRDALGRATAEQSPSGTESFAYDANSNLVKQVDFDAHERDFVFDDLNRETAEKWMDGATVLNTISTAYNAAGQVTSTGDSFSDYAFAYNGQGDQTSVDNAGTPGAPHVVLNAVYNAEGERTSLAATLNGTADFINNYSYDALSRLRDITQQGQTGGNAVAPKSIYIGLDGVGDITELNYSNSVYAGPQPTSPGYVTLTYSPTTGLLTDIDDMANGTSIDNLAYTYDSLARVSTFTSLDGTATYGYDHTSQLVSASYTTAAGGHQPANVSFTWDANGNAAAPGNIVAPNNEVTNDGTYTYTFDADGSRTSRTRISTAYSPQYKTTYTWDYRDRLTDVKFFDNNNVLTEHVHYVYDVYDNLIEEDIDPTGGGSYTTKEQFILDVAAQPPSAGDAPLEHFDASGNLVPTVPDDVLMELVNDQLSYRFLNGPSPSGVADVIYAEGAVASLTQPDVTDWSFVNNQGSPTDVVNSSGTLIDHNVYSAFGQRVYASDAGVFVLQGFSGGYADSTTGLIKFGERWYDPLATVWISSDPSGFRAGDPNLGRYVGNSPAMESDPTGLAGGAVAGGAHSTGFWNSIGNSLWSIGKGAQGTYQYITSNLKQKTLGGPLDQAYIKTFQDAYGPGPLGQTQNSSGFYYYGTRGSLAASTVCASAAAVVGGGEFLFLGNQPVLVEGVMAGGKMSSGGLFQIRPTKAPPWLRIDCHPLRAGGRPVPHIDAPPFNWHHWPWQRP